MAVKDTSQVSNEQVLVWAQRVEVYKAQEAALKHIRDAKYTLTKKENIGRKQVKIDNRKMRKQERNNKEL